MLPTSGHLFKVALRGDLTNMEFQITHSTIIASICIFAAVVALVYRAILPKPIPGIPYKKASALCILGDVLDVSYHSTCTISMHWRAMPRSS